MTRQYRAAAGRGRNAAEKTVGFWTRGPRTATGLVPRLPRVDLVPAVERYFDLVQRTVDLNRHLAVRCAEAIGTLSGVVREKAEAAGDVVREKAEKAEQAALEQAEQAALEQAEQAARAQAEQAARDKAEQAARDKAEQAARAQAEQAARDKAKQELARQARQAERAQARRAHKRARERYEGLAKAELSDLLAKRELPKTGNVDELIERLVEADSR